MFDRELAQAHHLSRHGAYGAATQALERALAAAVNDPQRVVALTALAHILPRHGDLQAALRRASEAVALARQTPGEGFDARLAEALTELCFIYSQFLMGRDALQTGWQALAAARLASDPVREAWALNRLAVAYAVMDQTDQACQDTMQALEIAQARPDDDPELLLSCLNNLAHFWLQAHAEAIRNGDRHAATEALSQAGPYADRAATLVREEPNTFIIVVTLSNQVEQLLGSGATERALALVNEYDALARQHGYAGMELQARAQRALLGLRGGPTQVEAAVADIQALLSDDGPSPLAARLRRQLSLALYKACKARGDYARALAAHEQLSDLERQSARNAMALQTEAMLIRQEFEHAQARAEHALQDARRERQRAEQAEQEQHKLKRQAAELGRMAHEDALTALNNRRHAEFALPLLLERARQERKPIALGLLDVDHFKRVNDTLGHGVGDLVLQQVAVCLRKQLRSADLLARVGGEEFMLVFVGVKPAKAQEICERLRNAIATHTWKELAPGLAVTVSIGLSAGEPPERPHQLVEAADQALYAAKHAGRNRVHLMGY
ncbi:diguanylate cyclase (GGDEF) domain-containing protein [Roseateles sp. YR242]|uniref:GGDEF domain-containing protein n=1 Tax=Roseateles sp. YR242 TaxID=1855305 RepID=UPI0008AEB693|nr:GGDEF domain-containing protein [Roseateles sp. YR242]SEK50493.1 diguanylate cyclase (GGDEF) domain-containing protein [Roseateles sp. YR242]